MRYYLQIVGTNTGDMSPSVVLHFDSQRYMFNCGEGTQRFCHEHKVRLAKVKKLFLTRVAWECVGGLPGMLLTLADAGTKNLTLHGPDNLTHFMAATRHFICRQSLTVETHEFHREGRTVQDENLTVHPIFLYPDGSPSPPPMVDDSAISEISSGTKRKSDDSDASQYSLKKLLLEHMFGGSTQAKTASVGADVLREQEDAIMTIPEGAGEEAVITPIVPADVVDPKEAATCAFLQQRAELRRLGAGRLPQSTRNPVALCYVCQGPSVPGKFDPVAAKSLGVRPGPDFGLLTKGESITTPSGNIVHPHQCVGPARPGATFIILDCPSPSYIPSLVSSDSLSPLYEAKDPVKCIVHIIGDGVLEDSRYKEWMQRFGKKTQHIIVSEKHNPYSINFLASATVAQQLNAIDSDIFPLPFSSDTAVHPVSSIDGLPKNTVSARPLMTFLIEPSAKLDDSECIPNVATSPTLSSPVERTSEEVDVEGFVVVPLGTGSAVPGKYRNVSSTLLTLAEGNILLDGGEGTLGQLQRHFGHDALRGVLSRLHMVFISHLHADHHLGIVRVLKAWTQARDPGDTRPLYVLGPKRYGMWLEEYSDCEDFGLDHIQYVDSEEVRWRPEEAESTSTTVSETVSAMKESLKLTTLHTVGVHHCPSAYAIVVEDAHRCKVVFSGDCRPSADLAVAGKGASLVIHEATLDDDMKQEAIEKRHCTTSEALQVAKDMEAQNVLLTHFSQRYPKIPNLPTMNTTTTNNQNGSEPTSTTDTAATPVVGIAFDLMRVGSREFGRLPGYLPAMQKLFREGAIAAGEEDGSAETETQNGS